MSYSTLVLHFLCLSLVHGLFLRVTTPSSSIQPFLAGVFGVGAIASIFSIVYLSKSHPSNTVRQQIQGLSLALLIFGLIWSAGIVMVTQRLSHQIAQRENVEASFFYGSSGTQFLFYRDTLVCWIVLIPVACLELLIQSFWKR